MHGRWIYRNIAVHDLGLGIIANKRKEELQAEIEKQQELGYVVLLLGQYILDKY